MKKIIMYFISILLGIIASIYFFIIWEPLKDDTINKKNNIIDISIKIEEIREI